MLDHILQIKHSIHLCRAQFESSSEFKVVLTMQAGAKKLACYELKPAKCRKLELFGGLEPVDILCFLGLFFHWKYLLLVFRVPEICSEKILSFVDF